jgi:hypothetical protein
MTTDLNAPLATADEEIFNLIVEEQKRQINCLEFIASEVWLMMTLMLTLMLTRNPIAELHFKCSFASIGFVLDKQIR